MSREIVLPDAEISAAYRAGATIAEIAATHGVSSPTILKSLVRSGVERRPAKPRAGAVCGPLNPAWAGGRRQRADGYWYLRVDGCDRLEHREVAAKSLGRTLRDDEIVHHRDGDRSNNNPSNLAVMSQAEHAALHAPDLLSRRNGHRGSSNPRAKLTDEDVLIIRSSSASGRSLASRFGVNPSTIHRIRNGSGWL